MATSVQGVVVSVPPPNTAPEPTSGVTAYGPLVALPNMLAPDFLSLIKLAETNPALLTPDDKKSLAVGAAGALGTAGVTAFMAAVNGAELGVVFGPIGMGVGGFVGLMAGLVVGSEAWNCFQVSFSQGGCATSLSLPGFH